jgi:serine/threonine protein kinase
VLQLVENGDLFDFIATAGGPLPEPICRFYFKQMLSALHYIHGKGLAHRDIKLENVLVDRDFNLKVADFGMVAPLAGRKGTGSLSTNCGTEMYKAPEILE